MNNEDGKETYPLQKRVQKIGIKVSAATEVETRKKSETLMDSSESRP